MAILELKTDITGSVWKVVKAVGDRVVEDEALMIMESMKMEIPVISPEAGVVREILVREGDTVGDGAVVARVEV